MVLDLFRLDGRTALVTGAARGLGRALAEALAEAGADLALVDLLPCDEAAQRARALGRRCVALERDLAGIGSGGAARLLDEAEAALGAVDILVNNAGIMRRAPAAELPQEDWEAVLELQLSAVFFLSQAAGARMVARGRGGKIINLASMLSFQGGLHVAAYTAAKSGVAGLTRALANEWARHGVNVNAIAPGYFTTEVTAGLRADPQRSAAVLGRIPAGRWGDPSDLKGTAVFLASGASAYLHGAIIPVDGGWLSW